MFFVHELEDHAVKPPDILKAFAYTTEPIPMYHDISIIIYIHYACIPYTYYIILHTEIHTYVHPSLPPTFIALDWIGLDWIGLDWIGFHYITYLYNPVYITLWLFNIAMERSTIFKFGKPSINGLSIPWLC